MVLVYMVLVLAAASTAHAEGSTVLVFKLARAFKVGDIIAYRLDKQMLVARVSTDGPHEGAVLVSLLAGLAAWEMRNLYLGLNLSRSTAESTGS